MPIYTRSQLKTRINAGIKGKIGMLIDADDTCNDVVRAVVNDIALRSQIRRSILAPNLFTNIYQYTCPVDINNQMIVDLAPQVNRAHFSDWRLTTPAEFDQRKMIEDRLIAIPERDIVSSLLVSKRIDDKTLMISTLSSIIDGGGTWVTVGDATNLVADSDNFVSSGASLKYDIGNGGTTTAGIKNVALNQFDLTYYLNNSIFHWVYIQSPINLSSYTLQIGSDSSNYYSVTVTGTNEGTAFVQGWNLLRFDMFGATKTGTPITTACKFVSVFMNKIIGKINETGYRANYIAGKRGAIYNLWYYSGYGWQDVNGNWKENSTDDSDYLNCDASEYNLFIFKGIEFAGLECEEDERAKSAAAQYKAYSDSYRNKNPDQSLILQTTYWDFISTESGMNQ